MSVPANSVPATIGGGEAFALTAELSRLGDPVELYARLADNGRRRDTMLYQGPEGECRILDQAAVRLECRGGTVTATALSAGGRLALDAVAGRLAGHLLDRDGAVTRFDFFRSTSSDAEERLRAPSPFDVIRAFALGFSNLSPGEPLALSCCGVLAYDHVEMFEQLPEPAADLLGYPDFVFWLAETSVVVPPDGPARLICTAFGSNDEGAAHTVLGQAHRRLQSLIERCRAPAASRGPPTRPEAAPPEPELDLDLDLDLDDEAYCALVERAKRHVAAGDVFQIVPSRTFTLPCADPLAAFVRLRETDPSPQMFYVASQDHIVFGASPETAVSVYPGDDGRLMIALKPIAGTRRRGADADEDNRLELDLRLDDKEIAEHVMLVDLARNDVARISTAGTRRVSKLLTTERFARVMHLVSAVEGELAPGYDAFDALQTCLIVGTLCGAPKLRAIQLLRDIEATKRGPYGGAVCWIDSSGALASGVIIRSATVRGDLAFVRAGAGVVADSVPISEADETRRKAAAVLAAIAAAGGGQ